MRPTRRRRAPRTRLVAIELPTTVDLIPAIQRIVRVVLANLPRGSSWKRQSLAGHLDDAVVHVIAARDGDTTEPHLDHALTRLAFVAALLDEERDP